MVREGISEATTKKVRTNRRLPLRKWQAQTLRLMSNRKQILREKCAGEKMLLRPALSPPLPLPPPRATSSNGFLEYILARHRLHRRRPAGSSAQPQDEPSVRIAPAARINSSADDRSTPRFL
jgi:hypothetical protein